MFCMCVFFLGNWLILPRYDTSIGSTKHKNTEEGKGVICSSTMAAAGICEGCWASPVLSTTFLVWH